MNSHSNASRTQFMSEGLAIRIDAVDGELAVLDGRVWVTRRGDLDDHVLAAGQRMWLSAHDRAVIEQWRRDQPAMFDWHPGRAPRAQPRPGALRRAAVAWPLRGVAFAAALRARRAQGCIKAGDSMASAGTVQ